MAFNRFRTGIILRVVLIALTLWLILFLHQRTSYVMTIAILVLVAVYEVASLIRFVERTERDLTRFLQAIKYEDFFESFSTGSGTTARRLHDEFSRIIQDFRRVRGQREEQYLYLQTVVQHIGIALISFDQDGDVELVNSAARRLFKLNRLKNIDALEKISTKLVDQLKRIRPGEKKTVKVMDEGELLLLSIHATEFTRQGRKVTLVSIQNIRSELEEKELEAWQNLIRVLTHEIRNSIAPITSLASTTAALLEDIQPSSPQDREQIEDVNLAIGTIQRRSKGLLNFVEAFRSLYKVPKPTFTTVAVTSFFDQLETFFAVQFKEKGVKASFVCEPRELEVTADPDLLGQVLINLVTNALQALEATPDPKITVSAGIDQRGHARMQVEDNGAGIDEETLERIFVPFFTTKPEGTGIGLSLSRQIMRLHKGQISVQSEPGKRTVFTLTF